MTWFSSAKASTASASAELWGLIEGWVNGMMMVWDRYLQWCINVGIILEMCLDEIPITHNCIKPTYRLNYLLQAFCLVLFVRFNISWRTSSPIMVQIIVWWFQFSMSLLPCWLTFQHCTSLQSAQACRVGWFCLNLRCVEDHQSQIAGYILQRLCRKNALVPFTK